MARKRQALEKIDENSIQVGPGVDAVARAIRRGLHSERSGAGSPEALVDRFLKVRASRKGPLAQFRVTPAELLMAFRDVGREEGVEPEAFYTLLLERLLTESDFMDGASSRLDTKGRVLDAAFEVFTEKGFHVATVDEIAERAGVGKGTLYRYFSNKEALFNELVRLRLKELEENTQAVFDGGDDVLTMITKYLRIYFEFFDKNQRLYRLIVQERPDLGDAVEDVYVKKVMRKVPLLKRKIYEASQGGVLKDMDFQTVFYGTMGFIHGVIQKWLAHECSYSLVEELPVVTEVLFHGFCADCQGSKS